MDTLRLGSDEISKLQKLGNGACGTVYKYGNDFAVKILNNDGLKEYNEEDFSKVVGIENETCVFPKGKVEVDGRFQGYVMKYVNGCLLWDVVRKLDLEMLILALQKAETDIKKLTKNKIRLVDLNPGGLMWSEDSSIRIIDTDVFERDEYESEEALDAINEEQFNQAVLAITHFVFGQPIYEHLLLNTEFSELVTKMDTAVIFEEAFPVDQLISKSAEIFEHEFGVKPCTIEEMETVLKEKNLFIPKETVVETPILETPSIGFTEQQIGEATVNVPTQKKSEAQENITRDTYDLEKEQ